MLQQIPQMLVSLRSLARCCFLIFSLSLVISDSTFASEWEEYVSVCGLHEDIRDQMPSYTKNFPGTTIHTRKGMEKTQEVFVIVVNDMMKNGWQPFGGPYTIQEALICQSMVRNNIGQVSDNSTSHPKASKAETPPNITPDQCLDAPTPACLVALAKEATEFAKGEDAKSLLLANIAVAQAVAGDAVEARRSLSGVAHDISQLNIRSPLALQTLSPLIVAQARVGDTRKARRIISKVLDSADDPFKNPMFVAFTLPGIAAAQTQTGDVAATRRVIARALEAAKQTEMPLARAVMLASTANAQAWVGDTAAARQSIDRALRGAGPIENAAARGFTYALIAAAQARVGDVDAARETITRALNDAEMRGDAIEDDILLVLIAHAQAEAGDIPGAVETAEKIGEEEFRAVAFAKMATALASQK